MKHLFVAALIGVVTLSLAIGVAGAGKAEASVSKKCIYAVGDARRPWHPECRRKAQPWVPGTAYYTEERYMDAELERTYDFAYCQGIRRFGHGGASSLTESFHVFSCTTQRNDTYCVRRRFKLVKAKRRNYHYTVMTRRGYCY
jgi:hypothetical protein